MMWFSGFKIGFSKDVLFKDESLQRVWLAKVSKSLSQKLSEKSGVVKGV